MSLEKQLQSEKLLPLYTVTDLSLLPIAEKILLDNDLHFIEVTYRSDLASEAIRQLADSNKLIVGAGTVCDLATAQDAIANGAQFIVMPGLNVDVVEYCNKNNIPVYPGAVTPTEIIQAMNLGLKTVKFFPANIYGGLNAIKNLIGPFPNIQFIPTGGINENNFVEYTKNNSILAVGGSFILSENLIAKDMGLTASKNLQLLLEKLNKQ
ncbi:TPA: bifunctional 4-hydroxy-2-oxoglutarate aldolase/2-dehydro-3-deoxy-phosphogluconate aldolase [Streptococcus suis]